MSDKARVLVIDDEEFVRTAIRQILEEKEYGVLEASSGREGIDLARRELPDLVICDIVMEGLDGYSTLQELRSDRSTAAIPLIIMTGYQNTNSMRLAMSLGADDFLVKPFPLFELLSSVEARLKQRRLVQEQAMEQLEALKRHINIALPPQMHGPLNSILTTARFLNAHSHDLPRDQIRDMADIIDAAAHRLQRLSENFLILAQLELLESNTAPLVTAAPASAAGPRELIEEAARTAAEPHQRTADIELELADCEPAIHGSYLARIVEELVDNACQHSEPGSKIIVASSGGEQFELTVIDRGWGMREDVVESLAHGLRFDRRLSELGGAGLGLVVTKGLAEVHGGQIKIDTRERAGTTVTVVLPLRSS